MLRYWLPISNIRKIYSMFNIFLLPQNILKREVLLIFALFLITLTCKLYHLSSIIKKIVYFLLVAAFSVDLETNLI